MSDTPTPQHQTMIVANNNIVVLNRNLVRLAGRVAWINFWLIVIVLILVFK